MNSETKSYSGWPRILVSLFNFHHKRQVFTWLRCWSSDPTIVVAGIRSYRVVWTKILKLASLIKERSTVVFLIRRGKKSYLNATRNWQNPSNLLRYESKAGMTDMPQTPGRSEYLLAPQILLQIWKKHKTTYSASTKLFNKRSFSSFNASIRLCISMDSRSASWNEKHPRIGLLQSRVHVIT